MNKNLKPGIPRLEQSNKRLDRHVKPSNLQEILQKLGILETLIAASKFLNMKCSQQKAGYHCMGIVKPIYPTKW